MVKDKLFKITLFVLLMFVFNETKAAISDTLDVQHYRIELHEINFTSREISATTTIRFQTLVPTNKIRLELKYLTVSQLNSNDITISSFSQHEDDLLITLASTLNPGQTTEIQIDYAGLPFHEDWGGFHYNGEYAFNLGVGFQSDPHNLGKTWFPCNDDFADKATYEVFVTVPEEKKAISGGLLTEIVSNGDGTETWKWNMEQEISTYLISVAVGNYELYSDVYQGIEAEISITVYARPTEINKVAATFEHIHEIMAHFESHYGAYPFNRIGYVGTAIGAMEHVDNIAFPYSAFSGNLQYEYLVAHELSHMWFGNQVTCADAGDMWLNEGWATFCAAYYKKEIYDEQTYRDDMTKRINEILRKAHIDDGSFLSLNNVPTKYTYGTTVYEKGATVVHTLMNYLGETVFFDAIKAYLSTYAYQSATSENLRDFLSEHTGIDLTDFFETWVFTPGSPHYAIDSVRTEANGSDYDVHVFVRQKHRGADHIGNSCIVELAFMDADWNIQHTDTICFSGKTGHSVKTLDFEPVLVMVDYFDKTADACSSESVLIEETGEYNLTAARLRIYSDAMNDPFFVRINHHWVAPDTLKTPVLGLRISPDRYWSVEMLTTDMPQTRARFYYQKTNILDAGLIQSSNDSIVLLYRPNTASDWQPIPFIAQGTWSTGYLFIDDLKSGEYTLGAFDKTLIGQQEFEQTQTNDFKLFPNPTKSDITIRMNKIQTGDVFVRDQNGKLLKKIYFCDTDTLLVSTEELAKGVYFIEVLTKEKTRNVKKLLIE